MQLIQRIAKEFSISQLKKVPKKNISYASFDAIKNKINKSSYTNIQKIDKYIEINKNRNKLTLKDLLYFIKHGDKPAEVESVTVYKSSNFNANWSEITHEIQIRRFLKKYPSKPIGLFSHEVIYYYQDGKIDMGKSNKTYFRPSEFKEKPQRGSVYNDLINKILDLNGDGDSSFYIYYPISLLDHFKKIEYKTTLYRDIEIDTKIYNKKIKHRLFKSNDSNTCLYSSVIDFLNTRPNNKIANSIKNKLIKNKSLAKPYTMEESIKLAIEAKSSFTFTDIINDNNITINKNSNNRFNIPLVITRFDHVEYLLNDFEKNYVTSEEYYEIKNNASFYVEKNGSLMTVDKTYAKNITDYKKIVSEWNNKNNMNLNYINHNDGVMNIINNYDYSMHRFFIDNIKDQSYYNLIDISKCYYNMMNPDINKFYNGFPSSAFLNFDISENFDIEYFNKQYDNNIIGFYQIQVVKHIKKHNILSSLLGLTINSYHVMTSEQINKLQHYIVFKFINCSIAPKIDLTCDPVLKQKIDKNNMIASDQNDKKNISIFSKMMGIWKIDGSSYKMEVKTSKDDADFVYNLYDPTKTNRRINKIKNNIFIIEDINENYKTHEHLLIYIHAYCKLNIMDTLLNVEDNDIKNIIAVKLDAIVYDKNYDIKYDNKLYKFSEDAKTNNMIKKKENINHGLDDGLDLDDLFTENERLSKETITLCSYEYTQTKQDTYFISNDNINLGFEKSFLTDQNIVPYSRVIVSIGKGGCGKTYDIIDRSSIEKSKMCYSSCSWLLITNKIKGTNIKGLSINRLTGDRCEKIKDNNIKIILLDEITLNDKKYVDQIIKEYYYAFIFLLGDVTLDGFFYQCSTPDIRVINPSKYNCQIIEYTKTYRFEKKLDNKLNILRENMNILKHNPAKLNMIKNHALELFKDRIFTREEININDDDVCISACKNNKELDEYYINKGTKPRYYIKATNYEKGMYRGAQIETKPDHANYDVKLFKSIHSFQGQELTNDNKLIINIHSNFDYQLYYTALSRSRRCDQIYIIKDSSIDPTPPKTPKTK